MTLVATAARLHRHREPLRVESVELSAGDSDDVVVDIAFGGVNPVDRYMAQGAVAPQAPLPRTLGSEGAGTTQGRRVVVHGYGVATERDGLWATKAVVPAAACVEVPDQVPLDQAAAMGVAGVTAWRCVVEVAEVTAEDRVLVLGASGGVGHMMVSLAARMGATTWGQTGDPGKARWVGERGATKVAVGGPEEVAAMIGELSPTVVFDPLGGHFTGVCVDALAPHGRLVLFGTSAGSEGPVPLRMLYRKAVTVVGYGGLIEPDEALAAGARRALDAVAGGQMEVVVGARFALAEINAGLDAQAGRQVLGKAVVDCQR